MNRLALAAFAAAALIGGPAIAAEAPIAETEAAAPKVETVAKAKSDKICKRVAITGSRQKKLVCQTAEDWGTK